MSTTGRVLVAAVALAACAPGTRHAPAPDGGLARDAALATAPDGARAEDAAVEPPLEAEEPEANPTSEKVKIRIAVTPVAATIFWGAKPLGVAGKTPLEVERPRGSGPLELVARAPGFLPLHTRALTDRDERLTLRLVRTDEAGALLGYKRAAPARPSD